MAGEPAAAQAFHGSSGWVENGGTARALPIEEMPRMRRAAARYAPIKIVDPPERLRIVRVDSIGGRAVYAAETIVDPKTTRTFYFDAASGLLVRESTVVVTPFIPLQEQVDYEDYRSIDGVMLPFVVRSSDDAPYSTSTRTFTVIEHGAAVDDALFARPEPPRR
jgi:hypothetical protein